MREEVTMFAWGMEDKLRLNDHKGGWQNDTTAALFNRLLEEAKELEEALKSYDPNSALTAAEVINEAVDVANFAMMIADLASKAKP